MGGGHPRAYAPTVAAKYDAREVLRHLGMDVGVATGGKQVIRRLATVMAGAEPVDLGAKVRSKAQDVVVYAFSAPDGSHLVALWTNGKAVEADRGARATAGIPGARGRDGDGHRRAPRLRAALVVEDVDGDLVIQHLLIKDYPIIIRTVDAQTRPHQGFASHTMSSS
jgi:hypothetical protein